MFLLIPAGKKEIKSAAANKYTNIRLVMYLLQREAV